MKLPLAIIVGKSIEDLVAEKRSEETVQERIKASPRNTGLPTPDITVKEGYETLPCVLDYSKEGVHVSVYSYREEEPPRRYVVKAGENPEITEADNQTQIIVSGEGILVRKYDYPGSATIRYAIGQIVGFRCDHSVITQGILETIITHPTECTLPSDFEGQYIREPDGALSYEHYACDQYDIRILLPENQCHDLSDEELEKKYGRDSSHLKSMVTRVRESLERNGYERVQ